MRLDMPTGLSLPATLPPETGSVLRDFVHTAQQTLQDRLIAAVLFGSAAEGRLRSTSDVNLILVLRSFDVRDASALAGPLALAHAAIELEVMFLEEAEIGAATECFAQKFADIVRRRHVVVGVDPFASLRISRDAKLRRTRQVLLNLTLRMRERMVAEATLGDRMLSTIADAIGPLRTCAALLFELEGTPVASPKDAFTAMTARSAHSEWSYLPNYLSALRDGSTLASPDPATVLHHLTTLATHLRTQVELLR